MGDAKVNSNLTNQWQRLSWKINRSSWTDNYTAQFRFDFEGMAANTIAYIDDVMLIDLTACFGSGKEPSYDWCDANIEYFAGTETFSFQLPTTYDLTTTTPSKLNMGDILNCPYSGSVQSITLPKGKYMLECWGAEGGYRSSTTYSGKGGYSIGIITLSEKTPIYLYTGGAGNTGKTSGGFNGGGKRQTYNGGGGASDIRIGTDSLYARVIVAGGGGSDGASNKTGMYGGGTTGGSSTQSYGTGGYGGTQTGLSISSWITTIPSTSLTTQAGAYSGFGFGGNGIYRSNGYGGAGGGGWYGGSGAYPDGSGDDDKGGGGGSGYVYTLSTASNYPSGCLLDSSYYLDNASTTAGNIAFNSPDGASETGHSGNGYIRITVIEADDGDILIKLPSILPSTYTQLDYIQSSGTQYIKTGLTVSGTTGFNATIEVLNTLASSPYYNLFGVRGATASGSTSESSSYFRIDTIPVDSNTGTELKYGTTIFNSGITQSNQKINIKLKNKVYTKPNGSTVTLTGDITSAQEMYICCINNYGTAYGNYASMKIYNFKIYDGDTLKADLVPARRNSDLTIGLYDTVRDKFLTNAGTGTFISGNEYEFWKSSENIFINTGASNVIPSGLVELEYIQSSGNQYINTGIIPDGNTRVECKFVPLDTGTQAIFCGGRTAVSGTNAYTNTMFYIGQAIRRDYFGASKTSTSTYASGTTMTIDANKNAVTINDSTTEITNFTLSSATGQMPILLLCSAMYNTSTSTITNLDNYAKFKVYYYKIYNNGTLVRNFIPVKRTSDGKNGLWDKVNYKFYTDENNGNFTASDSIIRRIASPGTAIEYIESSGTQYINTNILGQDISKVNVDFQFTSVPSGAEAQIAAIYVSSTVYFQIGWSGSSFMRTSEYTYSQTANSLARTQAEGTPTGRPNYTLWLFGQNRTGTLKHPASAKIYSCKIYDNNNTLVRDFIPIKTTTNIYGLWDKVTKAFYPNAGTGTFTGGSTVTLSGWKPAKGVWTKIDDTIWKQVL